MWFKEKKEKIDSEEYIELKHLVNKALVEIKALEIDLQLYVRKLKASKGIKGKEEEETETETNKNGQILPI